MSDSDLVLTKWNELKSFVSELEMDVQKNVHGNAAAGVRTRKGLRELRKHVSELVKLTVSQDKEAKLAKKAAKAAAKASV